MFDMHPELTRRQKVRERLLTLLPKGAIGAEIGVWEGEFSARILAVTRPVRLHLIDPWLYQPEYPNLDFGKRRNEHLMAERYHKVLTDFAAERRVTIHRATAQAALGAMPDGYLDWVYLDANLNEPHITADLALCLRKVKPGGIIAGDDYYWTKDRLDAPVQRAVARVLDDLGDQARLRLLGNQYVIKLKR